MSAQPSTVSRDVSDDVLVRAGRWLLAKVWLGALLSGAYGLGRHFGVPEAMRTTAAIIGAVALALVAGWLPYWTRERPTGIRLVDVGLRAVVWASLLAAVVALLIGAPAVGAVAGALLLTAAGQTFGRELRLGRGRPGRGPRVPPRRPDARAGGDRRRPR
jgi:hypothetical protein